MSTPEEIQDDIERRREELAHTVDQLGARLDVKARARAQVHDAKQHLTTAEGRPRPQVLVLGAAVLVGVGLLVWRRRR